MRDNGQVPNNPFPEIPITVPQIIRQVGHRTYQRGAAYQRNREVVRYSYDEDSSTLTGLVNGSTLVPYEVTIRFFPPRAGSAAFAARCTCPVVSNCKHAVALMLTALDRASVAKKALSEHPGPVGVPATSSHGVAAKSADVTEAKKAADPLAALRASGALTTAAKLPASDAEQNAEQGTSAHGTRDEAQGSFALNELGSSPNVVDSTASKISAWRKNLSSVLSARQDLSGIDSLRVSGALDLSMSVSGSYARGRNMPGATPAINLLARPLMRSKTGRWVKGGLTWDTFASSVGGPVGRHDIYPEHERFFAELYSIARPWQNMYSSHRDWISLSAAGSALLWDVLARAEEIGLPLLVNGREVEYAILPPARVRLRAATLPKGSEEGRDGGLLLEAALSWEGREGELLRQLWLPAAHCHPRSAGSRSRSTSRPPRPCTGRPPGRAHWTRWGANHLCRRASRMRQLRKPRIAYRRLPQYRVSGRATPPRSRTCPRAWSWRSSPWSSRSTPPRRSSRREPSRFPPPNAPRSSAIFCRHSAVPFLR